MAIQGDFQNQATMLMLDASKLAQAQNLAKAADVVSLTDSTGGTASSTLAAIAAGTAYAQADLVAVKNAIASLAANQNAILSALKAAGLMA